MQANSISTHVMCDNKVKLELSPGDFNGLFYKAEEVTSDVDKAPLTKWFCMEITTHPLIR